MGLRTKFNLLLLGMALLGAALFYLAATPVLHDIADQEVMENARLMMESAAGARKYTAEQIIPLLQSDLARNFHPQAVSAYAAKRSFDVLHTTFPDFHYREAALNPTNPEDRAVDWEADIINEFRAHPDRKEIVTVRDTPVGQTLNLARPLNNGRTCLECHSTPSAAPKSMIALYGTQNGFGWRPNEVIGAQIVSVPMTVPLARSEQIRTLIALPVAGVFVLSVILLNLMLGFLVVGPINKITRTAEAVSLGDIDAPEYTRRGSDQIAKLSIAFNRLRRSVKEALRMMAAHD